MYGEAVLVSLIVMLRSVSFEVFDGASQGFGDACHDLGLGVPFSAFDAGEVCVGDSGGCGESAQAVAVEFALPPDFWSIGLHMPNDTQRNTAMQRFLALCVTRADRVRVVWGSSVGVNPVAGTRIATG
jgi:hypothetical protein